jgi:hypothetical protein
MEFKYNITNEYILEDLKMKNKFKKFLKKDRKKIETIQKYILEPKNEFCRETKTFSEYLGFQNNYFLLYDNNILNAACAVTFNFNDEEDKIIGINIPFFCSKKTGYGGKLLKKIIEMSNYYGWYIKLKPTNKDNTRFYERYNFTKNKIDNYEYHYYFPKKI